MTAAITAATLGYIMMMVWSNRPNREHGWVIDEDDDDFDDIESELFVSLRKGLNHLNELIDKIQRGEHVPEEEIDKRVEEAMKLVDDWHDDAMEQDDDDEDDDDEGDELILDEDMDKELTEQVQLIDQLLKELLRDHEKENGEKDDDDDDDDDDDI